MQVPQDVPVVWKLFLIIYVTSPDLDSCQAHLDLPPAHLRMGSWTDSACVTGALFALPENQLGHNSKKLFGFGRLRYVSRTASLGGGGP